MDSRFSHWVRTAVVACALAAVVGPGPRAAEPEELPMPVEVLQKGLVGIRNHLQNISVKVGHGMAGVARPRGDDAATRPPTPAESCCASNLDRIFEKIHGMTRTLERLDVYFAERRDVEALDLVDEIRAELNAVSRGVAVLKMAGTPQRAEQAQVAIHRPYNRLRKAVDRLESCCPVDPAAWREGEDERRR
jgi:hypothetical protein